jgi:pimeloyl-ACP methyl ester carboxylesterase
VVIQLKRFFYLFWFRDSLPRAAELVAADGMAFLDRLWQDWSPGYYVAEDLARVKESLRQPANPTAAISYYRDPAIDAVSGGAAAYAAEEQAAWQQAQQPTLYLHGSADGCIGVELVRDAERHLAPGSRMTVVEGAGHFLSPGAAGGGQRARPGLGHRLAALFESTRWPKPAAP